MMAKDCMQNGDKYLQWYLLLIIAPGNEWRKRIVALIDECPLADPASMGFPEDWRTRTCWKVDG